MLTDEERREVMKEIARHPTKRSACVSVLKLVERSRGWVSDEIHDIAELLEMTPAELEGVATFFSHIYTRPIGKHLILICDSISCWLVGYEDLRNYLATKLGIYPGETTEDGQFTLMPIACLGICEYAPAMMIDETLYTSLTMEKLDEIFEQYK
jgi:NADH-quinone oxidoreductase subunit E